MTGIFWTVTIWSGPIGGNKFFEIEKGLNEKGQSNLIGIIYWEEDIAYKDIFYGELWKKSVIHVHH